MTNTTTAPHHLLTEARTQFRTEAAAALTTHAAQIAAKAAAHAAEVAKADQLAAAYREWDQAGSYRRAMIAAQIRRHG